MCCVVYVNSKLAYYYGIVKQKQVENNVLTNMERCSLTDIS